MRLVRDHHADLPFGYDADRLGRAKVRALLRSLPLRTKLVSIPDALRQAASDFAARAAQQKSRFLKIDLAENERTIGAISAELETTRSKQIPARIVKNRDGRSHFQLTAEFPQKLDAVGRFAITDAYCAKLEKDGSAYVAAIHTPDHHNDDRDFHLNIAFHDRPAKFMSHRWDFEIAVPIAGQHHRFHSPHRQNKIADFSRNSYGGGHRDPRTRSI